MPFGRLFLAGSVVTKRQSHSVNVHGASRLRDVPNRVAGVAAASLKILNLPSLLAAAIFKQAKVPERCLDAHLAPNATRLWEAARPTTSK